MAQQTREQLLQPPPAVGASAPVVESARADQCLGSPLAPPFAALGVAAPPGLSSRSLTPILDKTFTPDSHFGSESQLGAQLDSLIAAGVDQERVVTEEMKALEEALLVAARRRELIRRFNALFAELRKAPTLETGWVVVRDCVLRAEDQDRTAAVPAPSFGQLQSPAAAPSCGSPRGGVKRPRV